MNTKLQLGLSIFLYVLFISFSSCKTKSMIDRPDFDRGETTSAKKWKLPRDSFHFLTPKIEVSEATGIGYPKADDRVRAKLTKEIIEFQNAKFPDISYHYLELMKEDYRTVNGYLEYPPYYKFLNPNRIVEISEILVVPDKKYGALFSIGSRFGNYNDIIVSLIIINNEDQTIQKVVRREQNGVNALDEKVLHRYMNKLLKEVGLID